MTLEFKKDVEKRADNIKFAYTQLWRNGYSQGHFHLRKFSQRIMESGYSLREARQKALEVIRNHPDYTSQYSIEELEQIVEEFITPRIQEFTAGSLSHRAQAFK